MSIAIRSRRVIRLTDATGVHLANSRSLVEYAEGLIRCDSYKDAAYMAAWAPDRFERAALVREAAMRSRGIERFLREAADSAEVIISLERNCDSRAVSAWRDSRAWRRLAKQSLDLAVTFKRALQGQDLMREYGAARQLAEFLAVYERELSAALDNAAAKLLGVREGSP